MKTRLFALALGLAMAAAPARAEWREAVSANFDVFADASEAEVRDFASRLERFHYVLRTFHHIAAPHGAYRLRVFLLAPGSREKIELEAVVRDVWDLPAEIRERLTECGCPAKAMSNRAASAP